MRRIGLTFALLYLSFAAIACGDDADSTAGGPPCGTVTCAAAEYCCDASCGLCVEQETACPDACP